MKKSRAKEKAILSCSSFIMWTQGDSKRAARSEAEGQNVPAARFEPVGESTKNKRKIQVDDGIVGKSIRMKEPIFHAMNTLYVVVVS